MFKTQQTRVKYFSFFSYTEPELLFPLNESTNFEQK